MQTKLGEIVLCLKVAKPFSHDPRKFFCQLMIFQLSQNAVMRRSHGHKFRRLSQLGLAKCFLQLEFEGCERYMSAVPVHIVKLNFEITNWWLSRQMEQQLY